ncbi:hypothetical protein OIU35_19055 [Boseaceae bacterium BT-24-1]|nr:hypothetical protein [Boseaceae bacterium BT-24-1]
MGERFSELILAASSSAAALRSTAAHIERCGFGPARRTCLISTMKGFFGGFIAA